MSRLVFIVCCLLVLSHCVSKNEKGNTSIQKVSKPNIIYILADDLGYGDIGVYGQQMIKTPHIDRMASEGMMFMQHYAGSTVCAPSRSSLITGQHTGHTTIRGNKENTSLQLSDTTIAQLMKAAGYSTGLVGKWGLGEHDTPGSPGHKGFDYFYGFLNQIHAHNHYPAYLWENKERDSLANEVEIISESYAKGIGGIAIEKNTYAQDKFMEKALNFIEHNKDTSFFLYLAITLPHANNESGHWDQSGMEVPSVDKYKYENWPLPQKQHAAMISYLDRDVGLLLKKLKEFGIDDNTLVIFTSDNGPHEEGGAKPEFFDSNGQFRGMKRDLFEGGIRVPMIARWPNRIAPGAKTDHISAFWDVMPTFCEVAGVKTPATTDGISFLPTLLGKQQQAEHDYLYWEFSAGWIGDQQAVRRGKWKYIEKHSVEEGRPSEFMLYDLPNDPAEENNLYDQYPLIAKELDSIMQKAHVYSDDFPLLKESTTTN